MENKVRILITTQQIRDDGDKEFFESSFEGYRIDKNGSIFINYKENLEGDNSKATIKISDDEIVMLKSGEVNSSMRFKKDKVFYNSYETMYGAFRMSVETKEMEISEDDNCIKIKLKYNLKIEDLLDAENDIKISILRID